MKYTKENIVDGINAKIDRLITEEPNMEPFYNSMRAVALNYPVEVEQNMLEWVNNLPLTEVDCHGVSMKRVMEGRSLPSAFFLLVLKNFIEFKMEGFYSTAICYESLPGGDCLG